MKKNELKIKTMNKKFLRFIFKSEKFTNDFLIFLCIFKIKRKF